MALIERSFSGLDHWWMKDWGRWGLNAVFQFLDDEWIVHLSWAMEAVQLSRQSPLFIPDEQFRDIAKIMEK